MEVGEFLGALSTFQGVWALLHEQGFHQIIRYKSQLALSFRVTSHKQHSCGSVSSLKQEDRNYGTCLTGCDDRKTSGCTQSPLYVAHTGSAA